MVAQGTLIPLGNTRSSLSRDHKRASRELMGCRFRRPRAADIPLLTWKPAMKR